EAKVLIYVRATGAVDNTACRDFCGVDTLAASLVLRRLRDRGLLEKQGAGRRTYYTLAVSGEQPEPPQDVPPRAGVTSSASTRASTSIDEACNPELATFPSELATFPPELATFPSELATFPSELATFPPELATFPPELATLLATLKGRATVEALRAGIYRLCAWAPLTVDQLASLLGKDRQYLRNRHLIPMVRDGQLRFRYPESAKHPHQAYVAGRPEDF
ncbi:MAG: hypothetical protein LBQ62_02160, partial [Candidatus Accumulibacter sp.]|nr:hypothetical protein [Accumulibacter sp.]